MSQIKRSRLLNQVSVVICWIACLQLLPSCKARSNSSASTKDESAGKPIDNPYTKAELGRNCFVSENRAYISCKLESGTECTASYSSNFTDPTMAFYFKVRLNGETKPVFHIDNGEPGYRLRRDYFEGRAGEYFDRYCIDNGVKLLAAQSGFDHAQNQLPKSKILKDLKKILDRECAYYPEESRTGLSTYLREKCAEQAVKHPALDAEMFTQACESSYDLACRTQDIK